MPEKIIEINAKEDSERFEKYRKAFLTGEQVDDGYIKEARFEAKYPHYIIGIFTLEVN